MQKFLLLYVCSSLDPGRENEHQDFRRSMFSVVEYVIIYGTGLWLLLAPAELLRGVRVGVI